MRSARLVVVRRPKRPQPSHDISDSRFSTPSHLEHSLLTWRSPRPSRSKSWQSRLDSGRGEPFLWDFPLRKSVATPFLPVKEYAFQSLAELLVQRRHLLRQKGAADNRLERPCGLSGIRRTTPIRMSMASPSLCIGRNHPVVA